MPDSDGDVWTMEAARGQGERLSAGDDPSQRPSGPISSDPSFFEIDLDGNFLKVPGDLEEITGFSNEELKRLSITNLAFVEDRTKIGSAISAIKAGAPLAMIEVMLFSDHCGSHPVELMMVPDPSSEDSARIIGYIRDIESRKELEAELRQTVEMQEASQKFLTDFVSLLTREIRQPMTTMMLTLEMLDSGSFGELNRVQAQKVDQMLQIMDRIKVTLNEALEMSRNIDEETALQRRTVSIESLVKAVLGLRAKEIEARNINVITGFPKTTVAAEIDRGAMLQVISALIDRALEQSPEGGQVNIDLEHKDNGLLFSISDSGEGIPEEELPCLFNRLQLDHDIETSSFSEGLNLYIAKKVVERHGGRIWCESFVGIGSTFLFFVPNKRDAEVELY
ncbi:MAG: ATP-binding protein [Thermoplasmatota archaeon]